MSVCCVIDNRSPFRAPEDSDFVVDVTPTMSIPEVLQAIYDELLNQPGLPPRMTLMRIGSHGTPGALQLGTGLNVTTTVAFSRARAWFEYSNTPPPERLSPPRGQGIEIHGCNAAEGLEGADFLRAMAQNTRQVVTAGTGTQRDDFNWRFEGPTLMASEDGTFLPWGQ